MLLNNYSHQPGKSCRTVSLMNLLNRSGLQLSEEVIFGLCEGFDFSYVLPIELTEHSLMKVICPNLYNFENISKNLAIEYQVLTRNESNMETIKNIIHYENAPVIAEVALDQYKEYLGEFGSMISSFSLDIPISMHITEIVGVDNEYVYTYENFSKDGFKVPINIFMKARKLDSQTRYNPFEKLYRFQNIVKIDALNYQSILINAISNNIKKYRGSQNKNVGLYAFGAFIRDYQQLDDFLSEDILNKSLINSGYLIKYVSPGMFRKQYARFLIHAGTILGDKGKFDSLALLLNKADFQWNKLAGIMMNNSLNSNEKLHSTKVIKILDEIENAEARFIEMIEELISQWKM